MNNLKNFKELNVWEKAHKLTLKIYQATSTFPREELYGLTSQIRRSGASVPTNIAEGCGRNSDAELARFLEISMGSASEVEYLLLLTRDLNLINSSDYTELTNEVIEVKRMLASFIKKLRADS
jgi:four helix bundle protein